MTISSSTKPRVGSWPGYTRTQNDFLRIFLDGLTAAGMDVISFNTIGELSNIDEADVVLIHWPQRVFWESTSRIDVIVKLSTFVRALARRQPGTKVVWIVHDLNPHDAQGFQRWLWPLLRTALVRQVDGWATLSGRTPDVVAEQIPQLKSKPFVALHHPAYPDQRSTDAERRETRAELGFSPDDTVVGYCGQLRRNKGVEYLARMFAQIDNSHLRLLIAGHSPTGASSLATELRSWERDEPRMSLIVENLSPDRFRNLIGACDLFVAPFRTYLHSGSIVHALSAGRPVLTPATPFAEGLRDELGPGWVRLYHGELTAAGLAESLQVPIPPENCPLEAFAADKVGMEFRHWVEGTLRPCHR